jgi:hypothetical protein
MRLAAEGGKSGSDDLDWGHLRADWIAYLWALLFCAQCGRELFPGTMAASRRFKAEMETHVRQFDHEAVVSDFRAHLRVGRLGFPADLFGFFQIFKVGRSADPNSLFLFCLFRFLHELRGAFAR